jgi:hypothetical protein
VDEAEKEFFSCNSEEANFSLDIRLWKLLTIYSILHRPHTRYTMKANCLAGKTRQAASKIRPRRNRCFQPGADKPKDWRAARGEK